MATNHDALFNHTMNWKRLLYKTHRYLGLLIMIPVFFWALSGFMHPFMSHWFKPTIAKTFLIPESIDTNFLQTSLKKALEKNAIESFDNCRIVKIDKLWYYQVALKEDSLIYLSSDSGHLVNNLDKVYAEQLARAFLQDSVSPVKEMVLQNQYDFYYREINRLLPVWKVSFDREDQMDLYIETSSSRLGTFNNDWRKRFIWFFNTFHNWEFIPGASEWRIRLIVLISTFVFLTAVAGLVIYAFAWKKFSKSTAANENLKKRQQHRTIGIYFSVFMLMFSFSGCYHAFSKLSEKDITTYYDDKQIFTRDIPEDLNALLHKGSVQTYNLSFALINDRPCLRITERKEVLPVVNYYALSDKQKIDKGEEQYARELALRFSGFLKKDIISIDPVMEFKGEYGFVNKRLPVMKVAFNDAANNSLYIETSTGKLAAFIDDSDRKEGYSFSFLHKYVFLDVLGKDTRDIFTMFAALTLVLIAWKGFLITRK